MLEVMPPLGSASTTYQYQDVRINMVLSRAVQNGLLSGTVIITSEEAKVIQLAYIEISGSASCSWKTEKTLLCPKFITKGTVFSGRDDFYYSRHILCGGDIPHKHKGTETFHFSCGWPSRLPTSWIGDYGEIKFKGKITIHEGANTHVHVQELEVLHYRDLTLEQHLLHESRVDVHRTFQFTVSQLGSLDISIWVPISGIAAGQSLPVLCSITNSSKHHFGGLVFVLTRIDIYQSTKPAVNVRRVRTDICRVARATHIHSGQYHFYGVLDTEYGTPPTSQFYKCACIQIIYELWVSVQGGFSRYSGLGYPDTHTPGIPIIIGTEPLRFYNTKLITAAVLQKLFANHAPVFMDMLPPDEEVEEILHNADEELDDTTIKNLNRQMMEDKATIDKTIADRQLNSEFNIDEVDRDKKSSNILSHLST